MSLVEIATILSQAGDPRVARRESLSPAIGFGVAALISVALWALLLNFARWIANGLF